MINKLKIYDSYYNKDYSAGDQSSAVVFALTDRQTNLILSAPHATRSFTNKHDKLSDLFTGAITQYLGETENTSTLIRVKYTPYKCLISDYVAENNLQNHYFLDIHGFNQDIDYDICLGTAEYEAKDYPYLDKIIETAKKYNLKYVVNHPDYMGKAGLTGRYQKVFDKPNVIQMEIKKYLRDFYNHADMVENVTIPFLRDVIKGYKKIPD
ncbi:MAG: hypothetical protein IJ529_06135 [Alphaproteobacteria bacterium]|nr:hypothetical protein [Alphaproteobacteria bacterium]MBQ8678029.1 hypothetical protein [Alphaproteobacteria bacterium]